MTCCGPVFPLPAAISGTWVAAFPIRPAARSAASCAKAILTRISLAKNGFVGPEQNGLVSELGLELDARGNIASGLCR